MPAKPTAAVSDGLRNVFAGLGTGADKRYHDRYNLAAAEIVDQGQVEAAYRTSWLIRKIHDLPPFDMTREARRWQAEGDAIEIIENAERALQVWPKVRRALLLARLYGGGALIMGVDQGQPTEELRVDAIKPGALKYVHVVSRHQVTLGELETDIMSPTFGQPRFYELTSVGAGVRIHPSRVIPFVGQPLPEGALATGVNDRFWGDPLLQSIRDAMSQADLTQAGIAAMVHEAKIDTLKIPGLTTMVATAEGEARLMARLNTANLAKSITNTRIIDGEEEWSTRELTFSALPDVLRLYLQIAAGAADIPATRLLGVAPQGMNATGDGDLRNYYDGLASRQQSDLRPSLERLDAVMLASSGQAGTEAFWEFGSLWQMTPEAKATVQKTRAETAKIYADAGLVPLDALATAVQNGLVEDGVYPGLEGALDDMAEASRVEPLDPDDEGDPSALTGQSDEDVPTPNKPPARPLTEGPPTADALTPDERRGVIDRLWRYLTGEPA
jgi:phage-related protein (TIGR01555 family)